MNSINSKRKGAVGEREVAKILRENGFDDARRTAQFCGNTGDAADVTGLEEFDIHIEVKRQERISIMDWMRQAIRDCKGRNPLVVFRQNNGEWYCVMRFQFFLDILKKLLRRSDDGREEINSNIS